MATGFQFASIIINRDWQLVVDLIPTDSTTQSTINSSRTPALIHLISLQKQTRSITVYEVQHIEINSDDGAWG